MKARTTQNNKTSEAKTINRSAQGSKQLLHPSTKSYIDFLHHAIGNRAVGSVIQGKLVDKLSAKQVNSTDNSLSRQIVQGLVPEEEEEDQTAIQQQNEEEEGEPVCRAQKKLTMGTPGDGYEQEADRIAEEISSEGDLSDLSTITSLQEKRLSSIDPLALGGLSGKATTPTLSTDFVGSRKLAVNRKEELPLSEDGSVLDNIERRILQSKGSGNRLSSQMNSYMGIQTGYDFSNVRVKSDSEATALNQTLGSRAFTNGSDIWLGKGEKATDVKLMAHELTHVVQQGAANRIQPQSNALSQRLASKNYMPKFMQALTKNPNSNSSLFHKEILQFIDKYPSSRMSDLQAQLLDGARRDSINRRESAQTLRGSIPGCRGSSSSTGRAELKSGPTYSPNGTLKATSRGGRKYSPRFTRTAEFKHDPSKGIFASYGIVKQSIKWSSDADRPNHAGFTPASSFAANTWYEDRNNSGLRASPRSGPKSMCVAGAGSAKYLDSKGKRDCANGPKFEGHDRPMDGSGRKTGEWDFKLEAIDTHNGNKVLGTDTLTVDW
jgi:hypothetical protein